MFRRVRSIFKRRPKPLTREDLTARIGQIIRAKYDAAQTTGENRRHWANADNVSAVADAASDVRAVLRSRARHEVANNSLAKGIVLTLANDVVGRGPRLQFLTEAGDLNRAVEAQFANWSAEIRLGEKLRTMRKARAQDGEAFGVLVTNRSLRSPVKLDLRLIEADRVSTPTLLGNPLVAPPESRAVDGLPAVTPIRGEEAVQIVVSGSGGRAAAILHIASADAPELAGRLLVAAQQSRMHPEETP
ncbi:hypothetical protein LCGC14_2625390 [marine sediment metagenome]|uniref:Phage portal protein n=1 Tax=marine sediment metagenome TaxID=412755 RepID=A0A0F9CUB1_9ZZZZ